MRDLSLSHCCDQVFLIMSNPLPIYNMYNVYSQDTLNRRSKILVPYQLSHKERLNILRHDLPVLSLLLICHVPRVEKCRVTVFSKSAVNSTRWILERRKVEVEEGQEDSPN